MGFPGASFSRKVGHLRTMLRVAGPRYTTLFVERRLINLLARSAVSIATLGRQISDLLVARISGIEQRLVEIERGRQVAEPWTISGGRFTADDNRTWWNRHDWSALGEEWTPSTEWKAGILNRFLEPYIPLNSTVLEIGPGGGRWTEVLQRRCARVFVLDVADRALEICRQRFAACHNIEYLLGDGHTIPLPDDTKLDGVWSYDVFVHVNPVDARAYFSEFKRLLRPGGYAVVHHPGHTSSEERRQSCRSDLTDAMVRDFAEESRLDLVLQTTDLVNVGDVLSVFRTPCSPALHGREVARPT